MATSRPQIDNIFSVTDTAGGVITLTALPSELKRIAKDIPNLATITLNTPGALQGFAAGKKYRVILQPLMG